MTQRGFKDNNPKVEADGKKQWTAILGSIDTSTKVLALIALVAEALFGSACVILRDQQLLYALLACAALLIATIIGIVLLEKTTAHGRRLSNVVNPSPLTPRSQFLSDLINSAIQTVCRAVSLPETPQMAKLRVFIFRKEDNQLVCSHFWSQDPVTEQVGRLRFELSSEVARDVAVVRAAIDRSICRTAVKPLSGKHRGVTGDVTDDLNFVLAAPIKDSKGDIWGTVDFDTASETGRALLQTDVSNAVMFQLATHLSVIFGLEHQPHADA